MFNHVGSLPKGINSIGGIPGWCELGLMSHNHGQYNHFKLRMVADEEAVSESHRNNLLNSCKTIHNNTLSLHTINLSCDHVQWFTNGMLVRSWPSTQSSWSPWHNWKIGPRRRWQMHNSHSWWRRCVPAALGCHGDVTGTVFWMSHQSSVTATVPMKKQPWTS